MRSGREVEIRSPAACFISLYLFICEVLFEFEFILIVMLRSSCCMRALRLRRRILVAAHGGAGCGCGGGCAWPVVSVVRLRVHVRLDAVPMSMVLCE